MNRHSTDLLALLFGLAFAGAGTTFLAHQLSDRPIDAAWVAAIGFVVLGLVALTSTLLRRPHDDDDDHDNAEPDIATIEAT
ncbi:MAG TPA: hypothetical protein VL856_18530 [Acidimicrobiia bacterium]|nr:hypothetical protein [Acidimicrobiia bacterium]